MKIRDILETCIYASNLKTAESFYRSLPGIHFVSREENRHVFFRCGNSMLLIFNPSQTSKEDNNKSKNPIPRHGSTGPGHIAFSIKSDELSKWKTFLREHKIEIESEVTWPNGTVSIYFRDPAGNSLELVSPDLWD